MTPPPRILVVSAEQWPRALLRAQLDEARYDAIGAGTLSRALRYPLDDPERGPVRLIVLDSGAVAAELAAVEDGRLSRSTARDCMCECLNLFLRTKRRKET